MGLHDGVFGLFIGGTWMSHWMSQLGVKMLVQQNVGTMGKQVKDAFEFWEEEVAISREQCQSCKVGGGNHRRPST